MQLTFRTVRLTKRYPLAISRGTQAFSDNLYVFVSEGGHTGVGELGPAWLDRQRCHLKPSAYAVMEIAWRVRVAPRWGSVALGDIRPTAVQQWVSTLGRGTPGAKPLGASAVKRTHHVLSAILADAVSDNLIARNPASGVKLPPIPRKRPVYLTHRQVAGLAAAAGDHEALLLLAYTGLRWGETIGLRVRDLDMLRRRVMVSENAVQVGAQIHVGTPKAHKRRTVPLPEFLLPYLARQCEGRGREDLLFPGDDGGYLKRPHPTCGWFIKRSPNPACRTPRRTTFATPPPVSRCRRVRTSRPSRRCSAMPRRR